MVWMEAKDGRFVVKWLYRELEPRREADFPSKVNWNAWVSPKMRIFAWEVVWCKILTLDKGLGSGE